MKKCDTEYLNMLSGFVDDKDIKFLVKFGENAHLQQIVDGDIRFSPSQKYIKQEQLLHDKGQGDLLEGKMKIPANAIQIYSNDTNELIDYANATSEAPIYVTISIQDVNNMPISCFLIGTDHDCVVEHGHTRINFSDDIINTVKNDFHNPDSALVILEPQRYISDMKKHLNVVASSIRYYDYSKCYVQQFSYLCTGDENADFKSLSMTYENRYRHLLCKDIFFKNQKEYRFIKLDELIDVPKSYPFEFNYEYKLVSCEDLFNGMLLD